MAAKYDDYQWQFSDKRTKRLSDMTEDELQEALASTMDTIEAVRDKLSRATECIARWARGLCE